MPNRLATATSPYLLQHKDNPVDWHEWGKEAFDEALQRDVPILLSVGYAACHWCHVMAHESFEDQQTANDMNRMFVNIKVDREERPDVDTVYMEAVQAMTGHGGWPMTVWMDHQGRPFYAGTYFPDQPRHGMASFREVMRAVSDAWTSRRDDVSQQAERLVEAISPSLPVSDLPDASGVERAYQGVASSFDPVHGGFGRAPKFPQQPVLEFLLRVRDEPWAARSDEMVVKTLDEMAAGGIHDQIGGGFARYSVDSHWLVPHFEKMLYDNSQLARLYLWAGIEFGRESFLDVSRATLDYLVRDLRHPDGGFYSSEDADSEGVEGKFYVWSRNEIEAVLGDEATDVIEYFGVTTDGNFEGANILNVVRDTEPEGLHEAKRALLAARAKRPRPGLDDKVIAAWNGLAIRAFADAGAVLEDPRLLEVATACAEFCLSNLMVDGILMRSWRQGQTSVPGFLDDHASLAVGLLALYAATGDERWFSQAMGLVDALEAFEGGEGTFYSTSTTTSELPKRPTDTTDNPLPSGNALAAEALLLAALYTGDHAYRERSEQALRTVSVLMDRYPSMVGHHLSVLHSSRRAKELAIAGEDATTMARVYWSRFRPHIALVMTSTGGTSVPLLADRHRPGETLAYVCEGFVCDLPTADPSTLAQLLT